MGQCAQARAKRRLIAATLARARPELPAVSSPSPSDAQVSRVDTLRLIFKRSVPIVALSVQLLSKES